VNRALGKVAGYRPAADRVPQEERKAFRYGRSGPAGGTGFRSSCFVNVGCQASRTAHLRVEALLGAPVGRVRATHGSVYDGIGGSLFRYLLAA
jgi:hypothetical protein